MVWSLFTSPILLSRLGAGEQGLLIAAVDAPNQTATVLGSVPVAAGGFKEATGELAALLPGGLHIVGSYSSDSSSPWQPAGSSSVPVIAASITAPGAASWSVNGQPAAASEAAAPAAAAGSNDSSCSLHIVDGFVPLRCHLDVQLNVHHTASNSSTTPSSNANTSSSSPPAAAIQAAVQQLQQELLLPQQLVFVSEAGPSAADQQQQQQQQVPSTVIITSSSKGTVQDVLGSRSSSINPCLSLLPLQASSSSTAPAAAAKPSAPLFEYEPSSSNNSNSTNQQQQIVTSITLGLDVLVYAASRGPVSQLAQSLLVPALQQQLTTMQQLLAKQSAAGQPLTPVRAYHFQPASLGGLPVTVCYPMVHQGSLETAELKLLGVRQGLHQLLGLPDNVPMLKIGSALVWAGPFGGGGGGGGSGEGGGGGGVPRSLRLKNVHEGLTPPPGLGGQLYLIDGAYEYYHYMQDRFNDAGWGCAYRSLQTIVSWFRLQKYTSKPVPGHRQIQELLVSVGDKESSFIGSTNWIGAIELSYILDEYMGITSKVLTVNRGSEIPSHARALAAHFTAQGTPVMIGGGVLAYTLLGVAFNEDTGEAAFLILDPHYTGGEDIKKIQAGSWVAWKQLGDTAAAGGPLFVKDAFYNFLCPQRPQTV